MKAAVLYAVLIVVGTVLLVAQLGRAMDDVAKRYSESPYVYTCLTDSQCEHERAAVEAGRITEDDPRWDCETMGNRVCGAPR